MKTWRETIEETIKIWRKRAKGGWSDEICQICIRNSSSRKDSYCGTCPAIHICNGDAFKSWVKTDNEEDAKKVLKELLKLRKHRKYGAKKGKKS